MSSRSTTPPDYRTTDLYLAAYLKTAGVEMKRTDRSPENGRVYFVFDASVANIEELKAAWFNSTGRVVANTYAFHVKNLKSLCHSRLWPKSSVVSDSGCAMTGHVAPGVDRVGSAFGGSSTGRVTSSWGTRGTTRKSFDMRPSMWGEQPLQGPFEVTGEHKSRASGRQQPSGLRPG